MQNIVVIGRIDLKLERSEFSSNFEFDRNMLSGTGARTATLIGGSYKYALSSAEQSGLRKFVLITMPTCRYFCKWYIVMTQRYAACMSVCCEMVCRDDLVLLYCLYVGILGSSMQRWSSTILPACRYVVTSGCGMRDWVLKFFHILSSSRWSVLNSPNMWDNIRMTVNVFSRVLEYHLPWNG